MLQLARRATTGAQHTLPDKTLNISFPTIPTCSLALNPIHQPRLAHPIHSCLLVLICYVLHSRPTKFASLTCFGDPCGSCRRRRPLRRNRTGSATSRTTSGRKFPRPLFLRRGLHFSKRFQKRAAPGR